MLCSCKSESVTPVIDGLNCDFSLNVSDISATGNLIYSAGELTGSITPDGDEPIEFSATDDNVNLEYRGLKVSGDAYTSKLVSVFLSALDDAKRKNEIKNSGGEIYKMSGTAKGMSYILGFKSDGKPAYFSVPSIDLNVTFK